MRMVLGIGLIVSLAASLGMIALGVAAFAFATIRGVPENRQLVEASLAAAAMDLSLPAVGVGLALAGVAYVFRRLMRRAEPAETDNRLV